MRNKIYELWLPRDAKPVIGCKASKLNYQTLLSCCLNQLLVCYTFVNNQTSNNQTQRFNIDETIKQATMKTMVQSILNNQTSYQDYNGSIYTKQSNNLQRLHWFNLYETINQPTTKTITQSHNQTINQAIRNYVTFANPRICTIVL